jgi:flagellar basal-body rod protein FlgB
VGAGLLAKALYQPLFVPDTPPSRASPLPQGFVLSVRKGQAAEKRHLAETGCRFSGIAALPLPAKPRFMGDSWFGTRLAKAQIRKTGHPKVPDMSISFDKALGIHEKALGFRAQRAEVLANNIANADTPNYKARDLEFSKVLEAQSQKTNNGTIALNMTNSRHIEAEGLGNGDESLMYRTPMQPSIDQNTVDAQLEQSNYAENAVGFQASFTLLNSKFKGLVSALRGE